MCVCLWLEIKDEALSLTLLQLIETALVYKLSFSVLNLFIYVCVGVRVTVFDNTGLARSCCVQLHKGVCVCVQL